MYHVITFNQTDSHMDEFELFPRTLYEDDLFYQPEPVEKSDKIIYFLVKDADEVIARAALIFNPDLSYKYKSVALIAYYESREDTRAIHNLFIELEEVAQNRGIGYLVGPMNGSIWHKFRCINSYNRQPFFGEIYHKPYYYKYFLGHHYEAIQTYHSTITELVDSPHVSQQIGFYEKHFREEGVTIRPVDLDRFAQELEQIYPVALKAFQDSFFYTTLSLKEFLHLYLPFQDFIDSRFFLIAEKEGKWVGYIIAFPDWYDKRGKRAIVLKSVAVLDEHDFRGLEPLLIEEVHKLALSMGCRLSIHAHMPKDTAANMILSPYTHILREYALYGKRLVSKE